MSTELDVMVMEESEGTHASGTHESETKACCETGEVSSHATITTKKLSHITSAQHHLKLVVCLVTVD